MQLQISFINIILLIGIFIPIEAISILQNGYSVIEHSNDTNVFSLQINPILCITDDDCQKNSWCNKNRCECKKGWLIRKNDKQCLYKQLSKSSIFIISLLYGGAGADWFILSRKNILYILTGLLKFLITIAGGIWNRLAKISKTKTSITVAAWLGTTLNIITIIWWFTDWIRILSDNFPDGNGAPLF